MMHTKEASQRSILAGLIHLWTCDASNENQMWDWDPDTGRVKNRYGICMDAPSPLSEGESAEPSNLFAG